MDLKEMSAIEIGDAVNKKKISPTEVLQYFEKRITEENPKLNAIVYTKFDEAYERAKELEKELDKGVYYPLAGVPFALKDFLPSKKGWTNTHGGVKSLQAVDSESSEFCKAMESLGGIAIGKTNAPSFGFSGLTDNKMYGATRNPFNTKYNSGGSSGGSASAVGGKLLPVAEGGDGGGSIRVPSAWCNCVGYKPSVGRVPSVCRPDAWTATHPYCFNGCITRSVKDSALIFEKMFKYNSRDPLSVPLNSSVTNWANISLNDENNLKNIKIGITYDWNCFKNVDSEIVNAIENAIKKFESLGAKVIPVISNIKTSLKELSELWCRSISIDTAYDLECWKKDGLNLYEKEDELPEGFLDWQKIAINSTISDYKRFNAIRTELLDAHEDIFDNGIDFIISPVTVINPVENGKEKGTTRIPSDSQIEFAETFFQNFTGHPACSLPCGFTKEGLPIGIQIVGKKYHDEDMFYLMSRFYN